MSLAAIAIIICLVGVIQFLKALSHYYLVDKKEGIYGLYIATIFIEIAIILYLI